MVDAFSPSLMASPSPAPVALARKSISPFYYSILAIASTALLLVAYNIIVVRWCWQRHRNRHLARGGNVGGSNPEGHGIPGYKYKKEEAPVAAIDNECSVCLSGFSDGEDVRKLPKCKHLFHSECVDMWLYSHSNCPLCRAEVAAAAPTSMRGRAVAELEEEHSRQNLLVLAGSMV